MILVTGGPGSGKSALAEELITGFGDLKRYYLATMKVMDEEGKRRVRRHREARKDKGFITIERQDHITGVLDMIKDGPDSVILLECVANLVGNELYNGSGRPWEDDPAGVMPDIFADVVTADIMILADHVKHIVIVTDEYAEDDRTDEMTHLYLTLLNTVNVRLTGLADRVYRQGVTEDYDG
ncbi:MAG: bifunctional adenosylcobinamide kinase/adenosylcobinamide-phosphate guanylyltransferase [Lachnospiraceae bacterium]|nr:bifunctional adenosylcobinamide kinase/adenosylcobinamide-phosphate guanylyltransferase [Lachnospiraceae bacterium]